MNIGYNDDVMKKIVARFVSIRERLDWHNTLFLGLSPAIALIGCSYVISQEFLRWQTVVLFFALLLMTGLAITAGYHRLFAHKSYEASWPVRLFCLLFGAASFQNSALNWCSDHRRHHRYSDTDKDPYSIKKGFWHAHILWVCYKTPPRDFGNVMDLNADALVRFQHRHIFKLGALFGIILPALVAISWGDFFGGLFLAGFARVVVNHHLTFLINSLCHMVGTKPYSAADSARDNWVMSIFTYGEGYHNYHHAFPADYRNGARFYQWDPTKWSIWALSKLGLARRLKRTPEKNAVLSRIRREKNRFLETLSRQGRDKIGEMQAAMQTAFESWERSCARFYDLKAEYRSARQAKSDALRERLETLRQEMSRAHENMQRASRAWWDLQKGLALSRVPHSER